MIWKRCLAVLVSAILAGLSVTFLASSAYADTTLPFTDPNVKGQLGFCDKNNRPVTSGSLKTVPFVWKTVSSEPAPAKYTKGLAVLYAFSPLPLLDPGQWSPFQLTSNSFFSNAKKPMVQATYGDSPLKDQVASFPPLLDGYVQLRMYFTAVNRAPYSGTYPAAVIQVKGDKWTLINGDFSPPCTAGTAVSYETFVLGKDKLPTAPPSASSTTTASPGSTSSSSAGASSSPGSSDEPGPVAASDAIVAAGSGPAWPVIGAGLFVVLILGGIGVALWTSRQGSADS